MGFERVIPIQLPTLWRTGLFLLLVTVAGGCGGGRMITIRTVPPDASIVVDGQPRPRAPITERFSFAGGQFHTVLVTHPGYTDKTILLDGTSEQTEVVVQLKPRSRRVRFVVSPYPAIVKVDGRPVSGTPVVQASTELAFTVDASNNWVPHVVTAERPGFKTAERRINFTDADPVYNLVLEPERKIVTIRTEPQGAEVIVDGTSFGPSPQTLEDLVIAMDPQTNAWVSRSVRAIKPGYEPAVGEISWDDGRTDYLLTLGLRKKTIQVKTDPPDAIVKLDNKPLQRKADGAVEATLEFPPLNAGGEMPVYELLVTPVGTPPAHAPATLKVGWDEGKVDYAVSLDALPGMRPLPDVKPPPQIRPAETKPPEVKPPEPGPPAVRPSDTRPIDMQPTDNASTMPATRPAVEIAQPPAPPIMPPVTPAVAQKSLTLLTPVLRHENSRWLVEVKTSKLPIIKPGAESDGRKATLVATSKAGTTPDGLVTSADGSALAWAALQQKEGGGLQSRLLLLGTSGSTPPADLTDGAALDIMPSFSPDGLRVLFTSDRIGDGLLGTYEVMVDAAGFAVRAAPGETADTELSPTLDASPRPRLYVEARPTDGGEPRLVAIESVNGKRIDLGHSGMQPRISPRADSVVFTRADAATGSRDLWLLKLGAAEPVNLTHSPDVDEFDPAWSKTGSRIAFASERAAAGAKPGPLNVNLWVLRVSRPDELTQVTDSEARDDNPAWSGDDGSLYFRSSRGGQWGIWRIDLPR